MLSNGNTACQIAPPTFSKYTSIPLGGKIGGTVIDRGGEA
jgi:hypothetical protein